MLSNVGVSAINVVVAPDHQVCAPIVDLLSLFVDMPRKTL